MADLRQRIEAALREHRAIEVGMGCTGCSCGHSVGYAGHAADVVLAALQPDIDTDQEYFWVDERQQAAALNQQSHIDGVAEAILRAYNDTFEASSINKATAVLLACAAVDAMKGPR